MKRWFLTVLLLIPALFRVDVRAGVVGPSQPDEWGFYTYSDNYIINRELKETGYAKLVPGKTYYLSRCIRVDSDMILDATGATLVVYDCAIRNDAGELKKGYDSMANIHIIGGRWKSYNPGGNAGTSFSFTHAKNITLENMDISTSDAEGHGIELVSCKNVTIKNCKVIAQGSGKARSVEESIQIDLATPKTAPYLADRPYLWDGTPCRNITITGCTIKGCRGLCSNYAKNNKKYINRYHDRIVVEKCRITGTRSEALALFNATNVTVRNNTIITKSHRVKDAYSIGCHLAIFGTGKVSAYAKGKNRIEKNTIKGGRQGFNMCSHTRARYGKLVIRNNRLYSKKGEKNALRVAYNAGHKRSAKKIVRSGNKLYQW